MTDLESKLLALDTRTTRYKAHDGQERAVLLMDDYQWLLGLATDLVKSDGHKSPWEACTAEDSCNIPIGRKGSDDAPILVYGKYLKHPKMLALKIARLLNESEG